MKRKEFERKIQGPNRVLLGFGVFDERRRPSPAKALGVFLGRALHAFPGIRLAAAVQMSNHLHLVLEDKNAKLDRFMAMLLSPLAKALNAIDRVRGVVWERRYSAIPILDDEAFVDRIVYTLMNPVAAQLVRKPEEWPVRISRSCEHRDR